MTMIEFCAMRRITIKIIFIHFIYIHSVFLEFFSFLVSPYKKNGNFIYESDLNCKWINIKYTTILEQNSKTIKFIEP